MQLSMHGNFCKTTFDYFKQKVFNEGTCQKHMGQDFLSLKIVVQQTNHKMTKLERSQIA
jgi:hypothetical protein